MNERPQSVKVGNREGKMWRDGHANLGTKKRREKGIKQKRVGEKTVRIFLSFFLRDLIRYIRKR